MRQQRAGYHHGNLRAALLDAGLELTRTGGASALVLRDVTRRVGVSPNAAYRHFVDRQALLHAVAAQVQQHMASHMRAISPLEPAVVAAGVGAREALRAVGLGYISFALAEPGWFDVAFVHVGAMASPQEQPPLPVQLLVASLDGLVADGSMTAQQRVGAEWPCWSAVHGLALMALAGPLQHLPRTEVERAAERTVDAIIAGVLAPEVSPSPPPPAPERS